MTKIHVEPENLAEYHQKIIGEFPPVMHLIATNDYDEASLYLSDDDGVPAIHAFLHGIEVEVRSSFKDSDDLEIQAEKMYISYIGNYDEVYKDIDATDEDEEDDDENYSDDELRDMYGKDEDHVEKFEQGFDIEVENLLMFVADEGELLEFADAYPEEYEDMLESIKNDLCDTLLYYGLEIKRPMFD